MAFFTIISCSLNFFVVIYQVHISNISCDISSRYYIGSFFGLVVKFSHSVFYLFGPSVKNLVLWFSIYSVLRIWSTVQAHWTSELKKEKQFKSFSVFSLIVNQSKRDRVRGPKLDDQINKNQMTELLIPLDWTRRLKINH